MLQNRSALQTERKPIPLHLEYLREWGPKFVRRPYTNNGNLGFIMPGAGSGNFSFLSQTIAKIPFQQIGQLVGFSITLYGYYKIVVTVYVCILMVNN